MALTPPPLKAASNPAPFDTKTHWLLDGGMGTELEKKGLDLNHPLWSARALKEAPDLIFAIHEEYLRAGADIILTASYQASLAGFMQHGMYLREARETIFSSVMLACMAREKYRAEASSPEAAARPILIGASIGPYGATLADRSEYTGDYMRSLNYEKLQEYYEPKIEALLSPRKNYRVDFLAFETMPSAAEVLFILGFMKKYPNARLTFAFSRVDEALRALPALERDPQVAAWGFNCLSVNEISSGLEQVAAFRASGGPFKPLMVYPNGENIAWHELVKHWLDLGVSILGGCCQTGPEDISKIRGLVK
jgi:homocysteine S-methyltransferase